MRTAVGFLRLQLFLLAALALSIASGAGCSNDIDPDTLVRELRVLAIRFGDPAANSVAEVQATIDLSTGMPDLVFSQPQIGLDVLAVAPTGPGRRVATGPRPLQYDWFACLGQLSLFSPGSLDPDCRKFAPGDPPPRQNPTLRPLVAMATTSPALTLQTADLKELLGTFLQVLLASSGGGGTGGTGTGMLPTRPITLLLPVIVQVSVVGGNPADPLDSEVAYSFLRIVVALPGMTLPPPNHNPSLPTGGGVQVGPQEMGPMTELAPCADPRLGDCARYAAARTGSLYVTGSAQAGSVETYTPLDDSGRTDILETMRYSWFATDGNFDDARTGDQHPQTQWKDDDSRPAPPEVTVVDLWLVVQDERGGTDFQRFQLSLP